MSLDLLLEPIPDRNKAQPCKVGKILATLEPVYKTALENLLVKPFRDGGASDEVIADRMAKAGIPAGATIVNRHRRSVCSCSKANS